MGPIRSRCRSENQSIKFARNSRQCLFRNVEYGRITVNDQLVDNSRDTRHMPTTLPHGAVVESTAEPCDFDQSVDVTDARNLT